MRIEWNSVTWYSKLVAVVLFVLVFWTGFYFGGAFKEVEYTRGAPSLFGEEPIVVTKSISGLPESSVVPNAPTNFAKIGTVVYNNPGMPKDTLFLVYEAPGAPALSAKLLFDVESTCAFSGSSIPCLVMSLTHEAAFKGKRVSVEGLVNQENEVIVRYIRALGDGESPQLSEGDLIVSWPSAISLLKSCTVASVGQADNHVVSLTLRDGRIVRTHELDTDEVVNIVNWARESCGVIPIVTH